MRNLLAGPASETHIEPKVMQVLTLLAAGAPEVVERSRLLDEIWAGRAMSDEPLTRCIATLRRVLEDSAKDPQYIQTVPKLGYRLVSPVEVLHPEAASAAVPAPVRRSLRSIGLAAAATAVIAASTIFLLAGDEDSDAPAQLQVDGAQVHQAPVNSIAVLPFANLSPDPENEYLSDGLTTELLNRLSRIPDLKVAARTSAFSFKGRNVDATEIAARLRVAHILTGSVRQSGNRLRISAQLVDAADGYHVWTDTWEREFTDVFDMQDEIAAAVVGSLRVRLVDGLPTVSRADPEAYALYLKARELMNEPELGDEPASQFDPALTLIMQSIAIEPGYALAWGALAHVRTARAQWTSGDADNEYAAARAAAERALALDPSETRALVALGNIDVLWTWDFESAARWYKQALVAGPGDLRVLKSISFLYSRLGRDASFSGVDFADIVLERDPLNAHTLINLAYDSHVDGNPDAARAYLDRARKISPNALRIRVFDALFAYVDGDFAMAAELADGLNPPLQACALQRIGQLDAVESIIDELHLEEPTPDIALATIHACRGEKDEAFARLERAFEAHEQQLPSIRGNVLLNVLKDDPRWERLLQQIGISDDIADRVIATLEQSPSPI